MRTVVRCNKLDWTNSIGVLIGATDATGRITHHAEPAVFVPVGEGEYIEPTIRLDLDEAQSFMDELWRCGLRPSEGSGSAGALAATQTHLADMRRLVFDLLKKESGS